MKYHIEKNTVQETLIIPLYARKICSEHYPELFRDPESERICDMLDYDFSAKRKKMESAVGLFGALEVAQRQYDLAWEVRDYLSAHPDAAVVNLGCGLDATFRAVDNGTCKGYNLDMPDVIKVRDELLPAGEREENIACDLNDTSWFDRIDASGGAVFFASGVFYYFRSGQVRALLTAMAERFPGGVAAFDACNEKGLKMMLKTWLKEGGMTDVGAFFSVRDVAELRGWSGSFASVTGRSYMNGYRSLGRNVHPLHRALAKFCDAAVNMQIVKIAFRH